MCTSVVVLMDLDRGALARIDRKLLAGLSDDEAYRTVRVPVTAAKWSTCERHCDSVGISMVVRLWMLVDCQLMSVFGDPASGEAPVFTQRATEELAIRDAWTPAETVNLRCLRSDCAMGASDCDTGRTSSKAGSCEPRWHPSLPLD